MLHLLIGTPTSGVYRPRFIGDVPYSAAAPHLQWQPMPRNGIRVLFAGDEGDFDFEASYR